MSSFFSPEHLHVMAIHMPIAGTILAMIPLMIGIWYKNDLLRLLGVGILLVSLIALPISMGTGEEAYDRFLKGEVGIQLDEEGKKYAKQHYDDAEKIAKIGYIVMILSALYIIAYLSKLGTKHLQKIYILIIILNFFLIIGLGWVANSGGKIRHEEFRTQLEIPIVS